VRSRGTCGEHLSLGNASSRGLAEREPVRRMAGSAHWSPAERPA
jgi:hypothetical protein